jgi:hypothetical protein
MDGPVLPGMTRFSGSNHEAFAQADEHCFAAAGSHTFQHRLYPEPLALAHNPS